VGAWQTLSGSEPSISQKVSADISIASMI
jgi:hypothetical protein